MAGKLEEEGGRNEGAVERKPLVQQQEQEPAYLYFRQGRKAGRCLVCSVKVIFCSLGFWGDQKWNYIPRALFVMICITQAGYQISADCNCPYFDCSFYNMTHYNKTIEFPQTRKMCLTIFSLAAFFSYSIFLVCLIALRSKRNAVMSPSKSIDDVADRKEITLLFFAFFIIMALFVSGMVLLFSVQFKTDGSLDNLKPAYLTYLNATTVLFPTTVVLTHWASFNICHVFVISSLSLGKYLLKHSFFTERKLRLSYSFWKKAKSDRLLRKPHDNSVKRKSPSDVELPSTVPFLSISFS